MKVYTRAFPIAAVEGAEARPRDGAHRIRIMTGEVARDGDVVEPMGMATEEYLRNPVGLWLHDYVGRSPSAGLPIGRALALERRPEGIDVAFEFLAGDPFAERVRNAWEQGFLRTASISWQSLETRPLEGGRGVRHTRSNLIEWSLAPVPVDPGASRGMEYAETLRALGLTEDPLSSSPPTRGRGGTTEETLERFVEAARGLRQSLTP